MLLPATHSAGISPASTSAVAAAPATTPQDELVYFGEASSFPVEGGMSVKYGDVQLARVERARRVRVARR